MRIFSHATCTTRRSVQNDVTAGYQTKLQNHMILNPNELVLLIISQGDRLVFCVHILLTYLSLEAADSSQKVAVNCHQNVSSLLSFVAP